MSERYRVQAIVDHIFGELGDVISEHVTLSDAQEMAERVAAARHAAGYRGAVIVNDAFTDQRVWMNEEAKKIYDGLIRDYGLGT